MKDHGSFYEQYHESSPYLILGLIVLSFGLYGITWIYLKNKDFESMDEYAPDSIRGAIVMMILPLIFYFLVFFLQNVVFEVENMFITIIKYFFIGICSVLIFKYFADFTKSFSRITRTPNNFWLLFFSLGLIGIIGLLLMNIYMSVFILFFFIVIPAMQSELNSHFKRFSLKKGSNVYHDV